MRHIRLTPIQMLALLVTLAIHQTAFAGPCDAVPEAGRSDCEARVERECKHQRAPSSRARCEERVLKRLASSAASGASTDPSAGHPCDALDPSVRVHCRGTVARACERDRAPQARAACEARAYARYAEGLQAKGQTCESVPPHRQAECTQLVADKCHFSNPDSQARCVDRVITEELGPCTDKPVVEACQRIRDAFMKTCASAAYRPAVKDPVAMAKWLDMVSAMPGILEEIQRFETSWPKCVPPAARIPGCDLGAHQIQECKEADGKFKAQWGLAIGGLVTAERVDRELQAIESAAGRPSFMRVAARRAQGRADQLKEMLAMNARAPGDQVDVKAVQAAIARYEAKREDVLKRHAAMIASARCPQGKGGPAALQSTLASVARDFYQKAEPGDRFKKQLNVFRLDGPSSFKVEVLTRIKHEDQPAVACVTQAYPDEKICRIFRVTLRRTQPPGGAWSGWRWYSIGGGDELLCQNMK